jgi:hypothetical protein
LVGVAVKVTATPSQIFNPTFDVIETEAGPPLTTVNTNGFETTVETLTQVELEFICTVKLSPFEMPDAVYEPAVAPEIAEPFSNH